MIAGNPVTMSQMTRHVADAGSYAPVWSRSGQMAGLASVTTESSACSSRTMTRPRHRSPSVRAFFDLASRSTSSYDGGQLAYLLESPAGSLLVSANAGYWRGIFEPLRPDVAVLGAAGRPVLDGEPYQGSPASFLAEEPPCSAIPRSSSATTIPCYRRWPAPRTSPTPKPF